jgi:hypothetical protein
LTNTSRSIVTLVTLLLAACVGPGCVEKEEKPGSAAAPPPPAPTGPAAEPPRSARAFDPLVSYALVSAANGKCVQFQGGGTGNLIKAEVATCNGSKAQQFRLQAFADGYHIVINSQTNKCMDLEGFSFDDGAPVLQYPCHGQHNQQWVITDGSSGGVRFAVRHSGKGIEVKDGASADGTPIAQKSWAATPAQEFKLTPAEPAAVAPGAKAAGKGDKGDKADKPAKKTAADKAAPTGAAPR